MAMLFAFFLASASTFHSQHDKAIDFDCLLALHNDRALIGAHLRCIMQAFPQADALGRL
jgi:hypothetical protein